MVRPQQSKGRNFGADDHPGCPECGFPTRLIRRGPHPELGAEYEAQIFYCSQCDGEINRVVNEDGNPLP
jgi:hypothetical protein